MLRHTTIDSRLGPLRIVGKGEVLVVLYYDDHQPTPATRTFGQAVALVEEELFVRTAQQLGEYLDGTRVAFELPTTTQGTPFQERVWAVMRTIPYGATTTYGAVAAKLGNPRLARLVGGAVARNPLCIIDPCHRVLGAHGALTGYAGGLARKRALLELEGSL